MQIVPLVKQVVADKCPSNFNFDFVANGPVGEFVACFALYICCIFVACFACFARVCCRHCRQTSPHSQPAIPSSEATQVDGGRSDLVTFVIGCVLMMCSLREVLFERCSWGGDPCQFLFLVAPVPAILANGLVYTIDACFCSVLCRL